MFCEGVLLDKIHWCQAELYWKKVKNHSDPFYNSFSERLRSFGTALVRTTSYERNCYSKCKNSKKDFGISSTFWGTSSHFEDLDSHLFKSPTYFLFFVNYFNAEAVRTSSSLYLISKPLKEMSKIKENVAKKDVDGFQRRYADYFKNVCFKL